MATTAANAIKAQIESLGLSITAYRDRAPTNQATLPYVTIHESISQVPDALEDGTLSTGVELVQVDVWQQVTAESVTLVGQIVAGLHGKPLQSIGSKRVYTSIVRNVLRMPIQLEENIVHSVIDLDLWREL